MLVELSEAQLELLLDLCREEAGVVDETMATAEREGEDTAEDRQYLSELLEAERVLLAAQGAPESEDDGG